MKISLQGLFKLKPFDESQDRLVAGAIYANSLLFTIGILLSAGLGIVGVAAAIVQPGLALMFVGLSTAISAVVAGLEWNSGLKARALNQLFVSVVCVLALAGLSP